MPTSVFHDFGTGFENRLLAAKYSEIPFFLFLIWASFYLVMGKNVDLLTLNIGGMPVRLAHSVILVLSCLTFPLFRQFFSISFSESKKVLVFYACYFTLGITSLVIGLYNGANVRYALGVGGIFYYSVFFYYAFVLINSKTRLYTFLKVVLYSWLIGTLLFIFSYIQSSGGALPFGIRLSSDILPMFAGIIIVLYMLMPQLRLELKSFKFITFFAFAFLLMVWTKGVLLATAAVLTFCLFEKTRRDNKLSALNSLRIKVGLLVLAIVLSSMAVLLREQLLDLLPLSDGGKINVLIRLYMWNDIWHKITQNLVWGHGIVPFFSNTMEQIFVNIPKMSQDVNPHNSYLHLAYVAGVAAPVVFFMFVFSIGKVIKKYSFTLNESAYAIYCAAGVMLLAAFSTPVLELFYLSPYLWALLGIACRVAINDTLLNGSCNETSKC